MMALPPYRSLGLLLALAVLGLAAAQPAAAQAPPKQPLAVFDIRQYGAHGDGKTDNQEAIQAAIADAKGAGGGILFIPSGTFLHSGVLALGTRIVLRGNGAASVLAASDPAKAALRFDGASDCRVESVKLASTAPKRLTNEDASAIVLKDAQKCSIRDVTVEGAAGAGILVSGGQDLHIVASRISNTQGDGVYVGDGAERVTVEQNQAADTGDDSFAAVAFARGGQTDGVSFVDNTSARSKRRGIACIGAAHCRISGNTVSDSASHGIAVAYEKSFRTRKPSQASIDGNTIRGIKGRSANPIFIDGADGVLVSKGEIDDSNPVLIRDSSDVTVIGLAIRNAQGVPIFARNVSKLSIRHLTATHAAKPRLDIDGAPGADIADNRIE